jgi:hypothetical protein
MVTLLFGETWQETTTLPSFGSFTLDQSAVWVSLDFAAWRLQDEHQLLCSSSTENGVNSRMEAALGKLKGRTVKSIESSEVSGDLAAHFDGGLTFKIFCDQVDTGYDNYSFKTSEGIFVVGPGSQLRFEMPKT